MKKIYTIDDINGSSYKNGLLICNQKNNIIQINTPDFEQIKTLYDKNFSYLNFYFIKKDLILAINSEYLFYLDIDLKLIGIEKLSINSTILYNQKYVKKGIDYDYELFLPKSGIYDIEKKTVVFEGEYGDNLYPIENLCIITNISIIKLMNIHTGLLQWQFDVSTIEDNLRVNKIIGICNGVLLLALQQKGLLALDVNNGKLLWQKNTFAFNSQIDFENGNLILMAVNYVCIDIKTGEIKNSFINQEYFINKQIESQRENFAIVHNHIITTDWRQGVIGAFNTQTHQFDWIHKEEGVSFPSGSPIKYIEPYLFVQDNKNTLHIFENELEN